MFSLHGICNFQKGSDVGASVAVVRSRPDSDQVLFLEVELVSFLDKLMGSGDQVNAVNLTELRGNSVTEKPSGSSWRHGPGFNFFWVRPHEIREWTIVRHFLLSVNVSDLVESLDVWRESSVNAQDLSFNTSSKAHVVEHISAVFPWVHITVLFEVFIIESISARHCS
jgi:hypothetical protein